MREQRWVLAVFGRCLSYGARMCLCFWCLCLVITVVLGEVIALLGIIADFYLARSGGGNEPGYWGLTIAFGVALGLGSGALGAVAGVIAGIYSPRDDRDDSSFSIVFRSGSLWLRYGLLGGLASGVALGLVLRLFSQEALAGLLPIIPVAWLGQGYGLWRGINMARSRQLMNVMVGADSPHLESSDA